MTLIRENLDLLADADAKPITAINTHRNWVAKGYRGSILEQDAPLPDGD